MYEALIKRLRNCLTEVNCTGCDCNNSLIKQAADAIEELLASCDNFEAALKDSVEECEKEEKVDNVDLTWWITEEHAKLEKAEIENIKLREEFAKYRAKHRWIPVTEHLPERAFKEILPKYPYSNWMCISRNDDMWLARYNVEEKEWHDVFGEVITGVTHWMPRPEPPEREE